MLCKEWNVDAYESTGTVSANDAWGLWFSYNGSTLQACTSLAAIEQGPLLHGYILRRGDPHNNVWKMRWDFDGTKCSWYLCFTYIKETKY